jgi:hypothetical protein
MINGRWIEWLYTILTISPTGAGAVLSYTALYGQIQQDDRTGGWSTLVYTLLALGPVIIGGLVSLLSWQTYEIITSKTERGTTTKFLDMLQAQSLAIIATQQSQSNLIITSQNEILKILVRLSASDKIAKQLIDDGTAS